MLNINKEMNETAVVLSRYAINVMSLESKNGQDAWICELEKSTWRSNCTRLVSSSLFETSKIFRCGLKANQMCFANLVNSTEEIKLGIVFLVVFYL